jgi:3-oxoacyl-[acyl-carrier protein] reductase
VTGGTSGLGRATANVLVAEGANVVVSARDEANVARTVSELGKAATGVSVDNADPGGPSRLIDAALTAFGQIDGALISVGGPPGGNSGAVSDEAWRASFESVFLGALRIARHLAPYLAVDQTRSAGGAIAFVSSRSARSPLPRMAISNGLRPGLAMLAKDLADEFGPVGVRVLSLIPGRIMTARTAAFMRRDPSVLAASEAEIPMRRLGDPAEFGRVAAMMLSPAASYVTGCAIAIDGGASAVL